MVGMPAFIIALTPTLWWKLDIYTRMSQKSEIILLQIVKALESLGWSVDSQWQLSLKADGFIPLVRSVTTQGNLNDTEWSDEIHTLIRLKIATEDEITFFPEFSMYAQIAVGSVPPEDIDYKMMGNQSFTDKDVKDTKKAAIAAKEITRMVENHIGEVYQDYVDKNEDLVAFHTKNMGGDAGLK